MADFIDMTGKKFGRLTVISRGANSGTRATWNCICECGAETNVDGKKLRSGHTKSCGCYRVEVTAPEQGKRNVIHGQARTKGYIREKGRMRELAERRQMPAWADRNAIREIYAHKPEGHHVDHVIPLRGKLVSGLHVEYNLQYLPAAENMRKHNTYHLE